mgnify:CR=1 FL=1
MFISQSIVRPSLWKIVVLWAIVCVLAGVLMGCSHQPVTQVELEETDYTPPYNMCEPSPFFERSDRMNGHAADSVETGCI